MSSVSLSIPAISALFSCLLPVSRDEQVRHFMKLAAYAYIPLTHLVEICSKAGEKHGFLLCIRPTHGKFRLDLGL